MKKIIFAFKAQTIFPLANLDHSSDFLGFIVEGLGDFVFMSLDLLSLVIEVLLFIVFLDWGLRVKGGFLGVDI